jgi:hypothetical protein
LTLGVLQEEDATDKDEDADDDAEADEHDAALDEEFEEEEEEKKAVLRKEAKTMAKVEKAADLARVKADTQLDIADHLEALEKQMQQRTAALA